MAFPVDASRASYANTSAATTHNVPYPAGIQAGDLLILLFRASGALISGTPSGWINLEAGSGADASDDVTSILCKQADGTEAGTLAINISASGKAAAIMWRITGAEDPAVQLPELSTVVTGTSQTPDPGALNPSGGTKDYLWFWLGGWEGEQTTPPSTAPAGFSNWTGSGSGTGGAVTTNCRVAGGSRQVNNSTLDPASTTLSTLDDWSAWTMAVYPVSAGGAVSLASSVAGTSSTAADTVEAKTLAATLAGSSTVSPQASEDRPLAATVAGTSSVAAFLAAARPLNVAIVGVGAVLADIGGIARGLQVSVAGTGGVTVSLARDAKLSSTPAGSSTVAADLVRQLPLNVLIAGVGNTAADLSSSAGGTSRDLVSDVAGTSTVSGDFARSVFYATSISGTSLTTTQFASVIGYNTSTAGTSTVSGTFARTTGYNASVVGAGAVTGAISRAQAISTTILGTSTVVGTTFTMSQALFVDVTGAGFIMPTLTEPASASPPPIVPSPNDRRQRYRRMKGVHSV